MAKKRYIKQINIGQVLSETSLNDWSEDLVLLCEGKSINSTGIFSLKELEPFIHQLKQDGGNAIRVHYLRRDEAYLISGIQLTEMTQEEVGEYQKSFARSEQEEIQSQIYALEYKLKELKGKLQ